MILRCTIDRLLLHARRHPTAPVIVAYDGDESFELERVEAAYYELVEATPDEALWLEQVGYRLLRRAVDFRTHGEPRGSSPWSSLKRKPRG
jgi:hypothetical protein